MSTSLLTKSAAPPVISQPSSQFAPYFNNPQFNDTELVLVSSAEPPAKRQRISYNEASPCGTSTDTDNEDGAETKSVWVSKIILASHGEYWERLFSNGMRETTAKAITIEVPAHEQAAFIDMIRFMYTGQLQADTDANVIDVIIQADKFQASKVIGECARVLADKITSFESCLRYFELLATVGQCEALQRLRDRCTSFIVEYFIDFEQMFHQQEKMDQFKILDKQGVESIFRSDDLKVMSENSVFHALMVWVEHDLPNREADVADLMRHVRLPLMSLGFLRDCVASQPLVCKLPSVQEELIEALAYCGFCKDRRKWHRRTVAADRTHFYQKRHLIPEKSVEFLWEFGNVRSMKTGDSLFSDTIYLNGYWVYLEAVRNGFEQHDMFAVFLHVDDQLSKLPEKFFVKLKFRIGIKQASTGEFRTVKEIRDNATVFNNHAGKGRKIPWANLDPFILFPDDMAVKVFVTFKA
eukprot:TRINITY_DN2532_c0_g1_i5.p1 TRINITY_DN2532_c0_g1~~TRINITY_DN2532_c0_g1_i5.p1  ORF type:complete len:468 (-),score=155.68 TRINITY_DN2532_c0_g1_i5:113-1516(-)